MSEKKKTEVIKEVKEEVRQLTEEELEKLSGGGNASFNVEDWNGYAEPENSK